MSTLQDNLNAIKLDKNTNLLPENLKAGVTCLGVNGTYEGSGGGTVEGIKQFATVEAMQADTTVKEGDLAVVYRSEVKNVTADSRFQIATFPDTVVLDTAMAGSIEVRYRAVDSSVMFDCMGQLDSSMFRMDCRTETGRIRIEYTSSDGITYTRTDSTGNPVDFGTEIYYERAEMWNDAIGKFIQIGGNTFEGLFEYKLGVTDETVLWFASINDISFDYANNTISNVKCSNPYFKGISRDKIVNTLTNIKLNANINNNLIGVAVKDNGKLIVLAAYNSDNSSYQDYGLSYIGYNTSKNYIGLVSDWNKTSTKIHYWEINEETFEPVNMEPTVLNAELNVIKNYAGFSLKLQTVPRVYSFNSNAFTSSPCLVCGDSTNNTKCYIDSVVGNNFIYKKYDKYTIAPTQLSTTSDYVYEKEFYGKNGLETGTLAQDVSNSFADTNAGLYSKIKNQYDNMEPRILTDDDKTIDKNIYFIPVKKDGTVLLDTSNVTNTANMFKNCTNLTEIPLLNTSSVTYMDSMFNGCANLTTIPLLDTSKVTTMEYVFSGCTNLTEIPLLNTSSATDTQDMFYGCTNLTEIPLLDTSKVTYMGSMFRGCTNLTTIPLLDTSSVADMQNTFLNCTSLSDDSLNNILAMCTNAIKHTSNKTLKYIGLTSEQATRCQSLSNYSAFTAAGWTTGY